jgi:hypothetical protein
VEFLLEYDELNINCKDIGDNMPIHLSLLNDQNLAHETERYRVCKLLLQHGCRVDCLNSKSQSVMDIFERRIAHKGFYADDDGEEMLSDPEDDDPMRKNENKKPRKINKKSASPSRNVRRSMIDDDPDVRNLRKLLMDYGVK